MLKNGLPILKSVIKLLGLLGLTATSSAIDAGVQKKIYGSGTTTLVISNEEMNQIRKFDELRKVTTGKGDGYTAGCLQEYQYFKRPLSIGCS